MIGFLVTGHGEFSKGLLSSINMIAGEQEGIEEVNFYENANLEEYEMHLKEKVESLLDKNKGVIIFTDLLGGSPFRTAMMIASEFEHVEVVTGTNLPMLIEGTALKFTDDIQSIVDQLITIGREGVEHPQLDLDEDNSEDDSFEGGI